MSRLRIVYLSNSTIPSSAANSIHVMKMCQAFAKNGHEVLLLHPEKRQARADVADIFGFYGVEDCFEIKRLPWSDTTLGAYRYALDATREATRRQPDLVYGRFLQGCFLSSTRNLPVVYESHAPVEGAITTRMLRRLIHRKQARRIVAISDCLRDHLREQYAAADNIIITAHDAADAPLEYEQPPRPNDSSLRVGYVGQLYQGKGMDLIADLARRCAWAEFHIIGGKESDVAYWKQQTQGCGNIVFHGFVSPSETDCHRQSFDVLLAPYSRCVLAENGRVDIGRWMSPLKIFEYMAAGRAIICSDMPSLREVLSDSENALLCEPDDGAAWAAALERLRTDEPLRLRLGTQAKIDFADRHTWTARARVVIEGLPLA